MKKITYEEVHKLFDYNPDTGIFTNKINRGTRARKGEVSGSLNKNGYCLIEVNGKKYKAHRLAWMYVHGYFPENQIDHINQIRTDNRIENLREVSQSCNSKNCKIHNRNSSGVTGVSWHKLKKKWQVHIRDKNHKVLYLGYFKSLLEAAKARHTAEIKYGYPDCQTQSSALKYIQQQDTMADSPF